MTMTDPSFAFLQDWFAQHCDGDWEHDLGVSIATLDNPGWLLRVRIEDTEIEGIEAPWTSSEESEHEWLTWRSTGLAFEAYGGSRDLLRLVAAFQAFATQHGQAVDEGG